MNVKRFIGRNSREAMQKVRQAFGDHAVILSTKPGSTGIEIVAMPPESMDAVERFQTAPAPLPPAPVPAMPPAPAMAADADGSAMSTLSFQDYVRDRMRRRQAEASAPGAMQAAEPSPALPAREGWPSLADEPMAAEPSLPARVLAPAQASAVRAPRPALPALHDAPPPPARAPRESAEEARRQSEMMDEIRAMKGLIEERFGTLAFMERLQKSPRQAQLATRLLDCGFSPALIRKLADSLPDDVADEAAWAAEVLQRNLQTGEREPDIEDQGGVYAMIGSTGVGKTTSTAKLAAAFATRHGASQLGLVTLDAYRVGAHEQLRAYGRILGVPVHTAHDRAALEDLLDLLSGKRMVLIDTAGLAQRDTRTRELLDMLSHPGIRRLLVVNAAQQGETIEDVLAAYKASQARGVVLSKLDEAVKLGPALDAMIRHRLRVVAVANGQRVPEDWHRLTAQALMQRALRGGGSQAWRVGPGDVGLMLARASGAAGAAASSRRPATVGRDLA